jgi:sugar transferase (PEP-CTERM/EpsH1 system associated)
MSLAHDRHEAEQIGRVRDLGAGVSVFEVPWAVNRLKALPQLPGTRPLTHMLLDAPGIASALERFAKDSPPDVILACCSGMARFAMAPFLADCPLVIDLIDVDSAKWARLATDARWPMRWIFRREARYLADFERQATARASQTLVVNEREARLLAEVAPLASIQVIEVGVDLDGLRPPDRPVESSRVVFCGVMNYLPNVEGVLWFARHIWPLVRAQRPDASFLVVGSDPTDKIRRLAGERSGIVVTGTVPDVRPYLWDAALSVAPLRIARGVQNKVVEAVAAGLPAVVTSEVFEGLPSEVHRACRVADSVDEFATATIALLGLSGDARRALARQANLQALAWETQLAPLADILKDAAGRRTNPRPAGRL